MAKHTYGTKSLGGGHCLATYSDGAKLWYKVRTPDPDAKYIPSALHRIDGPAVEAPDQPDQWWIDGKNITEEVEAWIKKHNIDINTANGKMRFKLTFA